MEQKQKDQSGFPEEIDTLVFEFVAEGEGFEPSIRF